jgi:hypothetical protein
MKNIAYFFRDLKQVDLLYSSTIRAIADGDRPQKYEVIASVSLSSEKFDEFRFNFKKTHEYLTPHRVHADGLNEECEFKVVRVYCSNPGHGFPILVQCSGYSYARLTAVEIPEVHEEFTAVIGINKELPI